MRLEGRQQEIFEIVVEEFIKSARPVGSEFLAENYDLEVSSATIRNDLAFLEELGFLPAILEEIFILSSLYAIVIIIVPSL